MDILVRTKQHIFAPDRYFPACHAATVLALKCGVELAAWFAGSHEAHVDVGIYLSMRQDGEWGEPVCVARDEKWPCWNPVLHLDANGVVYLYYKVGRSPRTWRTRMIASRDNALSWSAPIELDTDDMPACGPVKNKMLAASDGRFLAPASIEEAHRWRAYVDISAGDGALFETRVPIPDPDTPFSGKGVIQPALWESAPGQIHALMRSTEGVLYRSDSADGGASFCPAYPTPIPNNNSGIDVVRMHNGLLALIYNPVEGDWGARAPLSIALSGDNGATFAFTRMLDDALPQQSGEFSYPAIIARGDRLLIVYTWNRKTIEFVEAEVRL